MNPRYRIFAEEQLSDEVVKDLFREQTVVHIETRGRGSSRHDFMREPGEVHIAPGRLEDFMTAIEKQREDRAKPVWYVIRDGVIQLQPFEKQGAAKAAAKTMAMSEPNKVVRVVRLVADYQVPVMKTKETLYQ